MFQKKINRTGLITVLMMVVATVLVSCGNTKTVINERYQTDILPTGVLTLEGGEELLYPYGNKFYTASVTESKVGVYDPAADMAYTKLAEIPTKALYVSEDEVYLADEDEVIVLDHTGAEVNRYPVPICPDEKAYTELYDTKDQIILIRTNWRENIAWICIIDKKTGEVKETAVQCEQKLKCALQIIEDNDTLYMVFEYTDETNQVKYGLFQYDPVTGKLAWEQDTEGNWGFEYMPGEDAMYGILEELNVMQFIRYDMSDKTEETNRIQVIKNLDYEAYVADITEGIANPMHPVGLQVRNRSFYTGKQFIVWNTYSKKAFIYDLPAEEAASLTVLYPVIGEQDPLAEELEYTAYEKPHYDILQFEKQYEKAVQAMTYPIKEFTDRLSMKLLAGEDDFDVVYADKLDEGDLLSAILRYQLYLPLEDYPEIMEKTAELADGILEYMTYDGHLIGYPYTIGGNHTMGNCFVVQPAFLETELPVPDTNWTLEDFWDLCEAAIPYCKDGVVLCMPVYRDILMQILQYGAEQGTIDLNAITEAMEKIVTYMDKGVLAWGSSEQMLVPLSVPSQGMGRRHEEGTLLSFPTYQEKKYTTMQAFIFINQNTKNKESAVQYLSMLFSPDYLHLESNGKSYVGRSVDSAYRMQWAVEYDLPYMPEGTRANTWNRMPAEYVSQNRHLVENMGTVFPGTTILTIKASDAWLMIEDVFVKIENGEMTVQEGAQELYDFAASRFME